MSPLGEFVMPNKVAPAIVSRQSSSVDDSNLQLATDVDKSLSILREALKDTNWKLDALSAYMRLDKSLISRVLNNERPLTQAFICALPDDAEALYEQRRAESFGLIVVAPVCREEGLKALVCGLMSVLSPSLVQLPAKAGVTAKADIRPSHRKAEIA